MGLGLGLRNSSLVQKMIFCKKTFPVILALLLAGRLAHPVDPNSYTG